MNLSPLEAKIHNLRAKLRPGQRAMADWQGGQLAVSAVPGAGKSTGMAIAAAITIARNSLHGRRQLVVVTFTRAAAASIKKKIRECLRQELGLPALGFMVHTLHGLALNIAQSHPHLSGIDLQGSTLVELTGGHRLIKVAVDRWISHHPRLFKLLIEGKGFDGEETEYLRRQSILRTEVLPQLLLTVVREAKSSGLTPTDLAQLGDDYQTIAAGLYEQYTLQCRDRNYIDYDDMILGALRVLDDPSARRIWQQQIFAVFEDEAQDSSPLQFQLLETLATDATNTPNLIRVGDPNQAINSTFTPADPIYFRQFCQICSQNNRLATMDQAGRSSPKIIAAANFLVDWANQKYGGAGQPPFRSQYIRPVPENDPQPDANPTGLGITIVTPADVLETCTLIAEQAGQFYQNHPEQTMAILVRENRWGSFLARHLKDQLEFQGLPVYDVYEHDRISHVPKEILAILQFIDRPHSPDHLKTTLEILVQRQLIPPQDLNALAAQPEQFLYPGPLEPPQATPVRQARRYCTNLIQARWQLSIYHLTTFVAFALQYDADGLATADKLGERIAQQTRGHNSLAITLEVLQEIISTEKFTGVDTENSEAQYTRPGQLTIITMHKAKGLDWDHVFLPLLHEDLIPGKLRVPGKTNFLGDYTLPEVVRAQIRSHLHQNQIPDPATAWQQAQQLKTAEEMRLLYVAMTRAKRSLWLAAERQAPFSPDSPTLKPKPPSPMIPDLIKYTELMNLSS